jgi:hypothetical protein
MIVRRGLAMIGCFLVPAMALAGPDEGLGLRTDLGAGLGFEEIDLGDRTEVPVALLMNLEGFWQTGDPAQIGFVTRLAWFSIEGTIFANGLLGPELSLALGQGRKASLRAGFGLSLLTAPFETSDSASALSGWLGVSWRLARASRMEVVFAASGEDVRSRLLGVSLGWRVN